MSVATYMFIDGAFLRTLIRSARKSYDLDENVDIDYFKISRGMSRAFYYDSYPSKKPKQTEEAHNEEVRKTEILFRKIGGTINMHVKHGLSRYRTKRGAEQKAVDILLALDVYRHATRENMDTAIIVTSDLDFAPVLEALLETKVRTRLWYDPKKTSNMLKDAADIAEPFNEENIMRYLPDDIPQRYAVSGSQNPSDGFLSLPKVATHSGDDWVFNIYLDSDHKCYRGNIEGRDRFWISSRDFRSVRFFAEGRYQINLEAMEAPNDVHLT